MMVAMASNSNANGIIASYIVAGFLLVFGLMIVSNWRDYSIKYFKTSPGNWFWRRHGFKAFRVVYGGLGVLFGLTILIINIVILLNR